MAVVRDYPCNRVILYGQPRSHPGTPGEDLRQHFPSALGFTSVDLAELTAVPCAYSLPPVCVPLPASTGCLPSQRGLRLGVCPVSRQVHFTTPATHPPTVPHCTDRDHPTDGPGGPATWAMVGGTVPSAGVAPRAADNTRSGPAHSPSPGAAGSGGGQRH